MPFYQFSDFGPTWLQVWGPSPSKIEAETWKSRCWKKHRFWHRFLRGSDFVLGGFLIGFLDPKCMRKAIWRKVPDKQKVLEKPIRNRCRRCCNKAFFEQNSMKNRMFFETSILEAFWMDLGKVLGAQNPWFSQFFRCFFEVVFEAHSGRAKKSI